MAAGWLLDGSMRAKDRYTLPNLGQTTSERRYEGFSTQGPKGGNEQYPPCGQSVNIYLFLAPDDHLAEWSKKCKHNE